MVNSNQKGKAGERELANVLKEMGFDTRRGVQYQGGKDSPDVVGIPGIHIECKRVNRLNLKDAMTQALMDAEDNVPAVFHRADREMWKVTIPLCRLVEFCRKFLEALGK